MSGCANIQQLAAVDIAFIVLHFLSAASYAYLLLTKDFKTKQWNDMDRVGVMCVTLNLLRAAFRLSTRQTASLDMSNTPEWTLVTLYRVSILLEHFFSLLGALALKEVLLGCVKSAENGELYTPVTIAGKRIDPALFLNRLRLFVVVLNFILYCIWAFVGVAPSASIATYNFWRRAVYITWGLVSSCISAPVLYFFGSRLLAYLHQANARARKQLEEEASQPGHIALSRLVESATEHNTSVNPASFHPSTGPAIQKPTPLSSEAQYKIRWVQNLSFAIWGCFTTYICIGIYFSSYIWANELFQSMPAVLLVTKIVVDSTVRSPDSL
ncbi:hypothetical protein HDU91_005111 [Kappamyces sp. JEL0680]|nr:hypothetical protein HDU91_005111 [Kappamyces sp. JEL0680]